MVNIYPGKEAQAAKLDDTAQKSSSVVYVISSVFPFQLFPDMVVVDKNKVTIIRKELFFKRIFPILIQDILTVKVNRTILFASMEFEIKRYEENPRPITFLWPNKAAKAEKYIMGLIQAHRDRVDLSQLTVNQIVERLDKTGRTGDEAKTIF